MDDDDDDGSGTGEAGQDSINNLRYGPAMSDNVKCGYDWKRIEDMFAAPTAGEEFYAIGFAPSSAADKQQLSVPKNAANAFLYTAAFFCKRRNRENIRAPHWFIYRIIFALHRRVNAEELPGILRKLEENALVIVLRHKRTKDPLTFLKDIEILNRPMT